MSQGSHVEMTIYMGKQLSKDRPNITLQWKGTRERIFTDTMMFAGKNIVMKDDEEVVMYKESNS